MRPILVLAAALLFIAPAQVFAQSYAVDRGSLILDGSAGLSTTRYSNSGGSVRYTHAMLAPSVLYFARPGLAVGGQVLLGHTSAGGGSETSFGVGPEVRYYFGQGEQRLYPFVSANFLVQDVRADQLGYGVSAGVLRMLSRSVGLSARVYYQGRRYDGTPGDTVEDVLGVGFGFSAFTF